MDRNEEERIKRIKQVGDYFIETNKSTREIAKYFSDNYFKISNKTVSKYIHLYSKLFGNKDIIQKNIDNNTSDSIGNVKIFERTLKSARLILDGYTIDEVAKELGETRNTIRNDIDIRFKAYCENDEDMMNYYYIVKKQLKNNMNDSLNNEKVRERVMLVARLSLEGKTNNEIAELLGVSDEIVKRDINERLKALCEQDSDMMIYYNAIKKNLEHNKNNNINDYNKFKK